MNMCNRWSPIQLYRINTHRIDCHCYEFITFAMVHSDFSPDAIRHQQSEREKKHELTMFCTFAGWSAVIVIYNNLNDFAVFIIISRMKMTQCNIAVNIVLVCMSTIRWTAIDFAAAKRHFICCHFFRFWFVCARQPQFNLLVRLPIWFCNVFYLWSPFPLTGDHRLHMRTEIQHYAYYA